MISIKYDDDDDDDDNDDDDDDIGVPGPALPFHVPPTPFLSSFFVSLLTPFLVTEILSKPSLLLVHLEPKMLLSIHYFSVELSCGTKPQRTATTEIREGLNPMTAM